MDRELYEKARAACCTNKCKWPDINSVEYYYSNVEPCHTLNLWSPKNLSKQFLRWLRKQRIHTIRITYAKIDDNLVKHFKRMKVCYLDLSYNPITIKGFGLLCQNPRIKVLRLNHTAIQDDHAKVCQKYGFKIYKTLFNKRRGIDFYQLLRSNISIFISDYYQSDESIYVNEGDLIVRKKVLLNDIFDRVNKYFIKDLSNIIIKML